MRLVGRLDTVALQCACLDLRSPGEFGEDFSRVRAVREVAEAGHSTMQVKERFFPSRWTETRRGGPAEPSAREARALDLRTTRLAFLDRVTALKRATEVLLAW